MHTHIEKPRKNHIEKTKTDRLGRETETPIPPPKTVFTKTEPMFFLAFAVMMILLSAQKNVLPQSGKTNVRRAAASYCFIFSLISYGVALVNYIFSFKRNHFRIPPQKRPAAVAAGLNLFAVLPFARKNHTLTPLRRDQYSTSPVNTSRASPVRVTCSSV